MLQPNYTNHACTDPTATVAGPSTGRFSGHGVTIRNAASLWMRTRSDLRLEITQKGSAVSLRFRNTTRSFFGNRKLAAPLDPLTKGDIRTFAADLAREYGLVPNFHTLKCGEGHTWFIVTFT